MAEAKTVVIWVFQRQFVTAWLSVRCLAGREADTEVFPGRDFRGHFLQYRNQWKPCLLSAFLVLSNLHYVSRLLSFLHLNSSCNNSFPVSASLLGLLVTLLWVPWRTEILSLFRPLRGILPWCHLRWSQKWLACPHSSSLLLGRWCCTHEWCVRNCNRGDLTDASFALCLAGKGTIGQALDL